MRTTSSGPLPAPTAAVLAVLFASCAAERDFSEAFLWPSSAEVALPTDLGLEYEPVELPTGSETTVHGWFIPAAEAGGRTVLFSHGNGVNITFCHPYYRFLHEAGFNVFVYDYRGFGKSWGEVSVDALLSDMQEAIDYLRARDDVDADRIALYGVSIGSLPTLRGAARLNGISGAVIEDVVDPRADFDGSFVTSYFGSPWALDPRQSARELRIPLLLLTGAAHDNLNVQFRVFDAAAGPKAHWLMPGAGRAPTSLLVQDREYQAAVSGFLRQCFAGQRPGHPEVTYRTRRRGNDWVVAGTVTRAGVEDADPWPVEIALLQDRRVTFHRLWLEGEEQDFELTVGARPVRATAWRYRFVDGSPESGSWQAARTPLARAAAVHRALLAHLRDLESPEATEDTALAAAAAVESQQAREPFPAALEAELVPLYWLIGERLSNSNDPGRRQLGNRWLERCVAAVPEDPALHYWPDSEDLVGFPHADSVSRASLMLAERYRQDGRSDEAIRVLEAAAHLQPDNRTVQQKLAEIRQQ